MEDVYAQMDEAFDKLWEECGCPHSKTTDVKGNIAARVYNKADQDTKVKAAKAAVKPATDD